MANHNPNGGRHAPTDENRGWRPQDQDASAPRHRGNEDDHDYGSWRDRNQDHAVRAHDPSRWEGSRGSELGVSDEGWRSADRHGHPGDERAPNLPHRSDMMRGAGSREDRDFRGGRGFEPDRGRQWSAYDGPQRQPMDRNDMRGQRSGEPSWGNQMGSYDQHLGYQSGSRPEQERLGYGAQGYGGSQDDPQRVGSAGVHRHRGTGPHRGKGPVGYQRSDERIRELVCEALADDDQIDASQIHVTVKDGEVTLTGVVDDRRTRREAEDCVINVSGVRDVLVQLRVKDDRQGQAKQGTADKAPAARYEPETSQDKKPRA